MKATNKMERFADFINAMDFSAVIRFFNFVMEDMLQLENHAMYDYHDQEDAINIIKNIGIEAFLDKVVGNPTDEERCVMYQMDGTNPANSQERIDRWSYCINPWTEILEGYADWILDHIERQQAEPGADAYIFTQYPELREVFGIKKKFKVRVSTEFYGIYDVEAYSEEDAIDAAEEMALLHEMVVGESKSTILPN